MYENQGNAALHCTFVFKRGHETKLEFMQKIALQRRGAVHLHSVFHMLALNHMCKSHFNLDTVLFTVCNLVVL